MKNIFSPISSGLLSAVLVNLSFSTGDDQIVLTAAFLIFLTAGAFSPFDKTYLLIYIVVSICYFSAFIFFINLIPILYYVTGLCLVSFIIGIGIHYVFLKKSKAIASSLCILTIAIGVFIEMKLPEWFLNRQYFPMIEYYLSADTKFITTKGDTLTKNGLSNKIIVIETWNINCGACHQEFKFLDELRKKYSERKNVVIIALNNGRTDSYEQFLKFTQANPEFSFIFAYDLNSHFSKYVDAVISPQTYLVNPKGKILFHLKGYAKTSFRAFDSFFRGKIDGLLGEK